MDTFDIKAFPYEAFGQGVTRQVRLVVSPETTGESRLSIVHTTVPAGALSEGHVHPDYDEYIYFDIGGAVILDGVRHEIPPMGLVHARAGVNHECVNLSPDQTLTLFCVFVPPLKPYGAYPALIEKTKRYLAQGSSPGRAINA